MTAHVPTTDTTRSPPRIWLIIGDKAGDNAQALALARSLGLPFEIRQLRPRQRYESGKPRFEAGLSHFDSERSDRLAAPWPALVITIGRRHAMAALWVKAQNPATAIVLLGRPRRWLDRFDLIVTLPQYNVPDLPNVLALQWPLLRPDQNAIREQAIRWQPALDKLARPLTAVLIGGPTQPYRLNRSTADRLVQHCEAIRQQIGGTLFYCTSRRTPATVSDRLQALTGANTQLYRWTAQSGDNPYQALLGSADYFVVTGDSVSMMIEVAACQKPLAIFALPSTFRGGLWQKLQRRLFGTPRKPGHDSLQRLGRWLYDRGISGLGRDLDRVQTRLVQQGFAVRTGEPFKRPTQPLPDETALLRQRVLSLVEAQPTDLRPTVADRMS